MTSELFRLIRSGHKPENAAALLQRQEVEVVARWMNFWPWLLVECVICEDFSRRKPWRAMKGGCMLCSSIRENLAACVGHPEWRTYRAEAGFDLGRILILADWCEENGFWLSGEALRKLVGRKQVSLRAEAAARGPAR